MSVAVAPLVVTEPGVYSIPEDVYHADCVPGGSLSSSGAKLLLPPSCPALFRWEQDHPRPATKDLDLGSAAHKLVLGSGPEIVVVEANDWRTKAAQEARDEAHATGAIPLLPAQHAQVSEMAAALREHPLASALFDPERGKPEQSLFWRDSATGVMRRGRLDWMPEERVGRPTIFVDFKSSRSAAPSSLGRHVADYGYHTQAAWYLDGIIALGLAARPVFWFVWQEKKAPYLVSVSELDAKALQIGREKNRQAIEIYARCMKTGEWPGYESPVVTSLPPWIEMAHENGDDWGNPHDSDTTDGW